MPPHDSGQRAFADFAQALRHPELPPPRDWVGPSGLASARRFGVYRNNVVAGLARVLADAYTVVHRLVGEPFFHEMACSYTRRVLPSSPILQDYGQSFADFIAQFEPAAALPYLADVARIERAWVEAYHEREAAPLTPSAFAIEMAGRVGRMHLALHPSLRVVRSPFPAFSVWALHQDLTDGTTAEVRHAPEDTLLIRPAAEVEVVRLPEGAADFLAWLAQGQPACEALARTLALQPAFDLGATLAGLVARGVFIGVTVT